MNNYDVVIIGAGAAGLMCSIEAGKRGRKTLLLDHNKTPGEKIRISGGGRCNFTNLHTSPNNFISQNPSFCISALKRYSQHDFLKLIKKHNISFHEKTLGQLFCDNSAQQIIDMLCLESRNAGVDFSFSTKVTGVNKSDSYYTITTSEKVYNCSSLVISTGGLSIPKIGATSFGYDIAKQFSLNIIEQKAALVPLTFSQNYLDELSSLAGVSLDVIASYNNQKFKEAMLFTHRGISGPAILQISSYWQPNNRLYINLIPQIDAFTYLKQYRQNNPKQELQTALASILPKKLASYFTNKENISSTLANMNNQLLIKLSNTLNNWSIIPNGTEGYRTAEVTLGGVDTNELSSKTFESNKIKGLYFIGEVIDVTGHLGGYNFQWAWSSGFAAGQFV